MSETFWVVIGFAIFAATVPPMRGLRRRAMADESRGDWEVFTADDGDPALHMTPEAALASAQRCIDSQRAEIDGYKREQDKLVDENAALRETVKKAREAFDHIPSDRRWGSLQTAIDAFTRIRP